MDDLFQEEENKKLREAIHPFIIKDQDHVMPINKEKWKSSEDSLISIIIQRNYENLVRAYFDSNQKTANMTKKELEKHLTIWLRMEKEIVSCQEKLARTQLDMKNEEVV